MFGNNKWGQLGLDTEPWRNPGANLKLPPQKAASLGKLTASEVRCGDNHTVVRIRDGTVYTFGLGLYGQLAHHNFAHFAPPDRITRIEGGGGDVVGFARVRGVAAGRNHSVMLTEAGEVVTAGANEQGQLGSGNWQHRCVAKKTKGGIVGKETLKVFAFGNRSAAIVVDGEGA
mmetsp:Transcript_27413/g.68778  ORF Transcript_27413/g.68778 Transcript_27413/m.68778 type:complete len:173 (+) Transcript_27413:449-967(+)